MARPRPTPDRLDPPALHDRAMDNLRFIRETMERSGALHRRARMGWDRRRRRPPSPRPCWPRGRRPPSRGSRRGSAEAAVALVIGGWALARKAQRRTSRSSPVPARRFGLSLLPAHGRRRLLTVALYRAGVAHAFPPGVWLLLYGAGVATGGAFSVRIVPVMGLASWPVGAAARCSRPAPWGDGCMAAGFGGLHLLFGAIIAQEARWLDASSPPRRPAHRRARRRQGHFGPRYGGERDAMGLDRLIHERMRLGHRERARRQRPLTFNELKRLLKTTDGNLSVARPQARGGGLRRLHKSLRRPGAEDRLPSDGAGPAGARALSRPHGSAHPRHAAER